MHREAKPPSRWRRVAWRAPRSTWWATRAWEAWRRVTGVRAAWPPRAAWGWRPSWAPQVGPRPPWARAPPPWAQRRAPWARAANGAGRGAHRRQRELLKASVGCPSGQAGAHLGGGGLWRRRGAQRLLPGMVRRQVLVVLRLERILLALVQRLPLARNHLGNLRRALAGVGFLRASGWACVRTTWRAPSTEAHPSPHTGLQHRPAQPALPRSCSSLPAAAVCARSIDLRAVPLAANRHWATGLRRAARQAHAPWRRRTAT